MIVIMIIILIAVMAQTQAQKGNRKILELEAENERMADYILAEQNERLLLSEDTAANIAFLDRMAAEDGPFLDRMAVANKMAVEAKAKAAEAEAVEAKVRAAKAEVAKTKAEAEAAAEAKAELEHNGLDNLLDMIQLMDLTGLEADTFEEKRVVVIFRFGNFAVRDVPNRTNWDPDILYRNVWVGIYTGSACVKIRRIIDQKLIEAAARDIGILTRIKADIQSDPGNFLGNLAECEM